MQKTVYKKEIQPIVNGQQNKGHRHITQHKAQASLQVGHANGIDHARHGNEGDTRNRCANHAKGHQIPGRLSVSAIKSIICGMPCRHPTQ